MSTAGNNNTVTAYLQFASASQMDAAMALWSPDAV